MHYSRNLDSDPQGENENSKFEQENSTTHQIMRPVLIRTITDLRASFYLKSGKFEKKELNIYVFAIPHTEFESPESVNNMHRQLEKIVSKFSVDVNLIKSLDSSAAFKKYKIVADKNNCKFSIIEIVEDPALAEEIFNKVRRLYVSLRRSGYTNFIIDELNFIGTIPDEYLLQLTRIVKAPKMKIKFKTINSIEGGKLSQYLLLIIRYPEKFSKEDIDQFKNNVIRKLRKKVGLTKKTASVLTFERAEHLSHYLGFSKNVFAEHKASVIEIPLEVFNRQCNKIKALIDGLNDTGQCDFEPVNSSDLCLLSKSDRDYLIRFAEENKEPQRVQKLMTSKSVGLVDNSKKPNNTGVKQREAQRVSQQRKKTHKVAESIEKDEEKKHIEKEIKVQTQSDQSARAKHKSEQAKSQRKSTIEEIKLQYQFRESYPTEVVCALGEKVLRLIDDYLVMSGNNQKKFIELKCKLGTLFIKSACGNKINEDDLTLVSKLYSSIKKNSESAYNSSGSFAETYDFSELLDHTKKIRKHLASFTDKLKIKSIVMSAFMQTVLGCDKLNDSLVTKLEGSDDDLLDFFDKIILTTEGSNRDAVLKDQTPDSCVKLLNSLSDVMLDSNPDIDKTKIASSEEHSNSSNKITFGKC